MINQAIEEVYEAIDFKVPAPSALIHALDANWLLSFRPNHFLYMAISDTIAYSDPTDVTIYGKIGHWTGNSIRLAREQVVLLEADCESAMNVKTITDEIITASLIGAALAKSNGDNNIDVFLACIQFALDAIKGSSPSISQVGEAISGIEYISNYLK